MQNTELRQVRTGGDPRQFPDFIVLRNEMAKQRHPARPDIHWDKVEQWSLSLFEQNGLELQSGAWYTLARSHRAYSLGMNEGLSSLCIMLTHKWESFWPAATHARIDILASLFKQLQRIFRTFHFEPQDTVNLQRLVSTLLQFAEVLKRHELVKASQIAPLLQQVQIALERLDNEPAIVQELPNIKQDFPPELFIEKESEPYTPHLQYVVIQETPKPSITPITTTNMSKTKLFLGGMLCAWSLTALGLLGWYHVNQPDRVQVALNQSLPPLPEIAKVNLITLPMTKKETLPYADNWLEKASQRIEKIDSFPPDWHLQYGGNLVQQAEQLWPQNSSTLRLKNQWQQQLSAYQMDEKQLNGWHEGMELLQKLSQKLNALDGQKGKYLTISELKTQVFAVTQALNQTRPIEDELRDMSLQKPISEAKKKQIQLHFKQLMTEYFLLEEQQVTVGDKDN
ncbi:MAG: VasL domain-containing protein [Vibrio sp.]